MPPDSYLPCSNLFGKASAACPEGGESGGPRASEGECTPTHGNADALQSSPFAFSCTLPWPPSVNGYFASVKGRLILSAKGRQYREAIKALGLEQRWPNFNHSRVRVEFEAWVPDKRRRDLDNILKSLCDSLTHAGIWHDDSQIDDLRIYRAPLVGGMVKARISALETA